MPYFGLFQDASEDGDIGLAVLEPPSDGYVSPEFDPLSEDEDISPPAKRSKTFRSNSRGHDSLRTLDEEEALALRLLRQH